jgi:hypothetical protein
MRLSMNSTDGAEARNLRFFSKKRLRESADYSGFRGCPVKGVTYRIRTTPVVAYRFLLSIQRFLYFRDQILRLKRLLGEVGIFFQHDTSPARRPTDSILFA